jgi:hypothetical protein
MNADDIDDDDDDDTDSDANISDNDSECLDFWGRNNTSNDDQTSRDATVLKEAPTMHDRNATCSSDLPPNLPIFIQARNWLLAASQHPISYVAPEVVFAFVLQPNDVVDIKIINGLKALGGRYYYSCILLSVFFFF